MARYLPPAERCCERIYGRSAFHAYQCERRWKVEREKHGKTQRYCTQHDPERIAARDALRSQAWDIKWDARSKLHDVNAQLANWSRELRDRITEHAPDIPGEILDHLIVRDELLEQKHAAREMFEIYGPADFVDLDMDPISVVRANEDGDTICVHGESIGTWCVECPGEVAQ